MTTLPLTLYNVAPGRSHDQVAAELHALAKGQAVLGLNEAIGYHLPHIPGFTLIRDTSRPGRANIAAYVSDRLPFKAGRWVDLREQWPRTDHPGMHDPRSILPLRVDGAQVIVAHQPPHFVHNAVPAQAEGVAALTRLMAPRAYWTHAARRRPRVVLADFNRTATETGPGPSLLARNIGGRVVGQRIDAAVVRNATASDVGYPSTVGGVRLLTDHGHAFRFVLHTARHTREISA